MGTITETGGQVNYEKCSICGALYNGWHVCNGYKHYTASMGDVIDELKKIEILLEKIYEELRMKR